MVIQIHNPLNIRDQSGMKNFSKMFIQMKLTKQELGDLLANISQTVHAYMLVIDGKYNNEDGMGTKGM
jgi:hypothetical protein